MKYISWLCGSTTYANSPLVQYKCNLSWKIMRWPHAYSRTRATKISTCGQSGVMASVVKKKFDGGSSMALQVSSSFCNIKTAALAIFSGNTLSKYCISS
jgi:hypothetical protein